MGLDQIIKNYIVERRIITITLEYMKLLLHAQIYRSEEITTMLWTYPLKDFAEKLNSIKMDDDGINPMDKFAVKKACINLKTHHTWGYLDYVLDEILQGNIAGLL